MFFLPRGRLLVSVYIIMNPAIFDVSFIFFSLLRISGSNVLELYKSLKSHSVRIINFLSLFCFS